MILRLLAGEGDANRLTSSNYHFEGLSSDRSGYKKGGALVGDPSGRFQSVRGTASKRAARYARELTDR
jgi:hypothetical protein